MSKILQDIETQAVVVMINACEYFDINVRASCFDGILIDKIPDGKDITLQRLLTIMEKRVKNKLGYNIKLIEKPMDQAITEYDIEMEMEEHIEQEPADILGIPFKKYISIYRKQVHNYASYMKWYQQVMEDMNKWCATMLGEKKAYIRYKSYEYQEKTNNYLVVYESKFFPSFEEAYKQFTVSPWTIERTGWSNGH